MYESCLHMQSTDTLQADNFHTQTQGKWQENGPRSCNTRGSTKQPQFGGELKEGSVTSRPQILTVTEWANCGGDNPEVTLRAGQGS